MEARDIYIEITDKSGSMHIQERRVWDADRFLRSVRDQYKKEGGIVTLGNREAYIEQQKQGKAAS